MSFETRALVTTLCFLALASGCAQPPAARRPLDVAVDSWQSMEVEELNQVASDAAEQGLAWSESAIGVALAALDYGLDARYVEFYSEGNRGEVSDTVVVVLGRDGFNDDSVRGDWHRAVLYRIPDGTWRFHQADRAFRCYRVRSLESYSGDLCP